MNCEMKWLAADFRVRLVLFTVWNTAVETKLFSACYVLPSTPVARTPRQSGSSSSLLLSAERDRCPSLIHIKPLLTNLLFPQPP